MNTATNLVTALPDAAIRMSSSDVLWLSVLATGGLVLMWGIFWVAVLRRQESITTILLAPTFFRGVTVMGVVAATVVLSLAGRLEGNLTGAILSGIVGYVLGAVSGRPKDPAG